MADGGEELGPYYVIPTILSFEGVDKQVNDKLGKVFGGAGKKASGELAKSAGAGLKALEAEVQSAGNAYAKLKDKADDALGKIRVEEEKLKKARAGGKEDQIAAAEERLAKARRDSARASKDAEAGNRSLQDAQKRLGDNSDDLGGRFGRLSGAVKSFGTLAGGAALAGIGALSAGVAVAGRELYELGSDFDEISDNLQVKTGLTGAALEQLKMSVQDLGTTNVPSTFADISDVAAEVTRNLHLTGQPLEEMTSRLANLDRMGQNVNIRDLGKAFRAFGVDVQDQPAAINALYEASTTTGLSIDDMTASIVKNGAALRTAGLDFGESAALVTTFEAAGLDADKMLAGITKSSVLFAKDGRTAAEGLRTTIDEIGRLIDAGDEAGAKALADKVFGAKGGGNFFDAVKRGELDVRSLSNSLLQTGIDINQVSADTADWSEKWQLLKNDVADALGPLASDIFDSVNAELTEFSDWVSTHKSEVIDFFVGMGETAISAAEVTVTAFAGVVKFFKLFDDLVMKSASWIPGYDDEAAQAFNDALGDLSEGMSAASGSDWEGLRENLRGFGEDAKDADKPTFQWGKAIEDVGTKADTTRGQLEDLRDEAGRLPSAVIPSDGSRLPSPGFLPPGQIPGVSPELTGLTPGGGGSGVGINLQLSPQNNTQLPGSVGLGNTLGAAGTAGGGGPVRKVGSDAGLLPQTVGVKDSIATKFAEIATIGGYRADPNFPNEHPSGKALDVMIPNSGTPQGKAYGDKVAEYALQQPGVDYVLWQQRQWNRDGTSTPMEDRGGPTANHMDHVHVHVQPGSNQHPQGTPPSISASTTALTTSTSSGSLNFPAAATGGGQDTAMLSNAFGAGYEPGKGTPGYNEYGDPGYYEQDQRAIAQADRRIEDSQRRIDDADRAIAEAEARKSDLDSLATEEDREKADRDLERAKDEAKRAREDAQWAIEDAEETKRGKFTAAKESRKSAGGGRGGQGGLGQFGELGSIAGSFLKETFGLDGSFFPDIGGLGLVEMGGSLLNAFGGPLQGLIDGALGVQQPGWSPGMPVPGMGTDGAAFGMPDVPVPPMPPPGQHGGSGAAPGPAAPVTIDASTTIQGNVGWSADEIESRRRTNESRAIPRIPLR